MALHLLENWCKGMSINPRNCLLGAIEPILRASAEYLSKCKMRGRMFVREEGAFAVLCELTSAVDPLQVPGTITVEDGEWTVITTGSQPSPVPASDVEFLKKMLWVKALGQALEKVMPPHPESSPYRKLRLFSGGPTPIPGEEAFETWLENTTEMLQEWVVPDAEKRRRLVECLRGPALDVIRTLKLSNPGVKVKDCLEALDHAFGRTEGSDDVYCKFLNARQQKGEKVSAYIQRLEKLLQKAIMRGAVAVEQMDLTRLFQVWTDNNPLTYVLTSAKLDATGQRWVAALASYEFSIQYRSGRSNVDTDALSRRPQAPEVAMIPTDGVRAICSVSRREPEAHESLHGCVAEALGLPPNACLLLP
uniref:Uncharacterized protein n=1 Tax=Chrysemys picta bellii TaxID=8478 RepID=A0A8C3HVH9_CHRPI